MSKIRIKNFGPIKGGYLQDNGWINIRKVTLFVGNQGSGKSTVAKLISTLTWIEKALTRGDYDIEYFQRKDMFKKYLEYHRIDGYFGSEYSLSFNGSSEGNSEIDYIGDSYAISYRRRRINIVKVDGNYDLPQLMYVPADRNFLSTVDDLKSQRLFSEPLVELLAEQQKAKKEIRGERLKLPINNTDLEYDEFNDILMIRGSGYAVKLVAASSGFQSLVPLYLVSWYLANTVQKSVDSSEPMSSDEQERFRRGVLEIQSNLTLTDEQRRIALSALSNRFNKTAFINIVEEPEQNLFPESQWEILKELLIFNNYNPRNKLVITTHSPYIINYLTLAIQTRVLYGKIHAHSMLVDRLERLMSLDASVDPDDVAIYQMTEDGKIELLPDYHGIPTDKNYLNLSLAKGNELFDELLGIEEEL